MLRKRGPTCGWTAQSGFTVPDLDDATDIIFSGTSSVARSALSNADWFLRTFPSAERSWVLGGNMDVSDTALASNNVWSDTDGDDVGDTNDYSARILQDLDKWAFGGHYNKLNAFADETCRSSYGPQGRLDRCSLRSTVPRLNSGGAPLVETPTFVRMDIADNVISKRWTLHPNPLGFSLLVGGHNGTLTDTADFRRLMRETLVQLYDEQDTVSGVVGPW